MNLAEGVRARARRRIAVTVSAVLVGTLLQGAFTPSAAQADDMPKVPASDLFRP